MKINQVLEEKQNSLLNRKELKIIVEAEKNPSMAEVLKLVAEDNKVDEDKIAVKDIQGKFGRNTFLSHVLIYSSKEEKEKTEPKKKEKKK